MTIVSGISGFEYRRIEIRRPLCWSVWNRAPAVFSWRAADSPRSHRPIRRPFLQAQRGAVHAERFRNFRFRVSPDRNPATAWLGGVESGDRLLGECGIRRPQFFLGGRRIPIRRPFLQAQRGVHDDRFRNFRFRVSPDRNPATALAPQGPQQATKDFFGSMGNVCNFNRNFIFYQHRVKNEYLTTIQNRIICRRRNASESYARPPCNIVFRRILQYEHRCKSHIGTESRRKADADAVDSGQFAGTGRRISLVSRADNRNPGNVAFIPSG